jgi:hypothetical protein
VRRILFKVRFLGLIAIAVVAGVWPVAAQAAATPGSAASFAVLAGSAVTCTSSTITGLVGVNFKTTAGCATAQYAPDAYNDFQTTYAGIAANLGPCTRTFTIADTLPATLGPGVYCFTSYLAQTGTTLRLTGAGPWWFEIGIGGTGYLEATNFTVLGGNPCNAFWWVRQYAAITDSTFQGTILGGAYITLTRTTIAGRAWATTAATMTNSTIGGGCSGNATAPGQGCEGENADGGQTGNHAGQNADRNSEGCNSEDSHQGSSSEDSHKASANHKVSVAAKVETPVNSSAIAKTETKSNNTSAGTVKRTVKSTVKSNSDSKSNSDGQSG